MGKIGSTTFIKPHLLVVEGKDDFGLMLGLLDELKIETVQIVEIDGVNNLASRLKLFPKTPGWVKVERLGVLVDSDLDISSRHQAIRSALKDANLDAPLHPDELCGEKPKVLFSTLPGPGAGGSLETLILRSIPTEIQTCIEQFMNCAGVIDLGGNGHYDKSCVHAYISASENAGLKIGEAVSAGAIDIASSAFDGIRNILRVLVA